MDWKVYIIRCSDNSFYTGITNNLERRLAQHAGQSGGAKYFRGRKPVEIVYVEQGHDRSSASRREAEIKKMTRMAKSVLIDSSSNEVVNTELCLENP